MLCQQSGMRYFTETRSFNQCNNVEPSGFLHKFLLFSRDHRLLLLKGSVVWPVKTHVTAKQTYADTQSHNARLKNQQGC